jgi:cytidylate kinase
MTVITISREFGSGGSLLAEKVASALGYHLVDKAFISEVLRQYGLAEFDIEYEKQPGFWEGFDTERYERRDLMVRMLNQVVRAVARHGNVVILGRSGYAILAGLADVLHVRLQAPFDDRVATVSAAKGISPADASMLVKGEDKIRRSFVESFYRTHWDAAHAFDIAINTAHVPVAQATEWVIQAARLPRQNADAKPTTRLLDVDAVMRRTIAERLHCTVDHAP